MFALTGILAALHYRQRTGLRPADRHVAARGGHRTLGLGGNRVYLTTGKAPQPVGSSHRLSAPYQAFRCADGYMTVGAANDRTFARLCAARPRRLGDRTPVHDERVARAAPRGACGAHRGHHRRAAALRVARTGSTRPASRADPLATTARCFETSRSSRATCWSRSASDPGAASRARDTDQDVADAARPNKTSATAWRAQR